MERVTNFSFTCNGSKYTFHATLDRGMYLVWWMDDRLGECNTYYNIDDTKLLIEKGSWKVVSMPQEKAEI